MNQVNSSKCFNCRRIKSLSSKFKLPNRSAMAPAASLSVNPRLYYYSFHDHLHPPKKQPDLLLSVEKVEKETIHNILLSFPRSRLLEILEEAAIVHPSILHAVLSMIDGDPSRRKLFVRSLGPFTTSESLRRFFSRYGVVEEATVVSDKDTGNSKGYGFVTFASIEAFLLALRNPSKKIDGFVSFCTVCVESDSVSSVPCSDDRWRRTIRVENVPPAMTSETLVELFGGFGEIQEGPGGFFDMGTGRSTGFAILVYKNEESAEAALAEPCKNLAGGFKLFVKKAMEKEKGSKVQPWPMPLGVVFLLIIYYYYFHSSRGGGGAAYSGTGTSSSSSG